MQSYVPQAAMQGPRLIRLGRESGDDLPPMFRAALADAHLRAGHLRTADRLFKRVVESGSEPWSGFAAVSRGWVAVLRADFREARARFTEAAPIPGATALLADFLVGMLEAGDGDSTAAVERFTRIAAHPNAPEDLRAAAMLAEGYVRFAIGDDAGAKTAFARVMMDAPSGPFADDARYGAALAHWRSGDAAGAEERLREVAGGTMPNRKLADWSEILVSFDPRAMVRASARRYREVPLRTPTHQVVDMLDRDVRLLARATLARVAAGRPVAALEPQAGSVAAGHPTAEARPTGCGELMAGANRASSRARLPVRWGAVVALVALASIFLVTSFRLIGRRR